MNEWWSWLIVGGYGLLCYIGGIWAHKIDARRMERWKLHDAYNEGWEARTVIDGPACPTDHNPYTL